MRIKNLQIGEIISFGTNTLVCKEIDSQTKNPCKGCFFENENCLTILGLIGSCVAVDRKDSKDVIFVELQD